MERYELERELKRLHGESWGWALSCTGHDRELAEDVLQTAYLRMLSGIATSTGGSSIRTWAFGVIRLTALEELRKRRRSAARVVETDSSMDTVDSSAGPDVLTERAERADALSAALTKLSERQREVLQLVFYHDMTIEAAARVMNVSVGSARTHYQRGKAALATAIAHFREVS